MGVSNDFNRDRRPRKIDYNWRTGQVMENAGYHAGSDAKLLIGGIQVVKRYESPPCTASDLETCTVDACAADACAAIDACAFSTRAIKFESTKVEI